MAKCPDCNKDAWLNGRSVAHRFLYGQGKNAVELWALVAVGYCSACDIEFSVVGDEEAQAIEGYLRTQEMMGEP